MALDLWINSEAVIYRIDKDTSEAHWLKYTTIKSLWWKTLNAGRVKLSDDFLPSDLDELKDGDCIEILRKKYGPKDEYNPDEVVMRLSNCQIKRKWVLNINPPSPDCQEVVMLYVSLTCDIEIVKNGIDK